MHCFVSKNILFFFSDLRTARNALLALFNNSSASPEKMDEASSLYFALVQGLFHVPEKKQEQSSGSKNTEADNKDKKEKSGDFILLLA